MFIYSLEKKTLINTAHIAYVVMDPPKYEAKDWRVYCYGTGACHTLFRGTEKECEDFLEKLRNELNS